MTLADTRILIKIKETYLTDSGISRGKKIVKTPGPYTTRRSIRQDLNQLANNPNTISPIAKIQQTIVLPKILFFTPVISIPGNEYTLYTHIIKLSIIKIDTKINVNECV